MKSFVNHIQINILDAEKSFRFYKDFLGYLEYKIVFEDKETLGMRNGTTDIWLIVTSEVHGKEGFHRKRAGLNHIAFGVESKDRVDEFIGEFLQKRKIKRLYDSPRHYPEYEEGYYAVYFEDPDRIKLEVVYKPGLTL